MSFGNEIIKFKKIEEELSMILTNDQAGRLIGRNGKNVKNLRNRFKNTGIYVSSSIPRIVKIKGKNRVNVWCLIKTQII